MHVNLVFWGKKVRQRQIFLKNWLCFTSSLPWNSLMLVPILAWQGASHLLSVGIGIFIMNSKWCILLIESNNQFQYYEFWIFTTFYLSRIFISFLEQCFGWEGREVRWRSKGPGNSWKAERPEVSGRPEVLSIEVLLIKLLIRKFVKFHIRDSGIGCWIQWARNPICSSDQIANSDTEWDFLESIRRFPRAAGTEYPLTKN